MGSCKLAVFNENSLEKWLCHEVRFFYDSWLITYKEKNRCSDSDRRYMEYKDLLDNFLKQCKCHELKCEKCSPQDHEGYFCRCEMRNIALAKKYRDANPCLKWNDINEKRN